VSPSGRRTGGRWPVPSFRRGGGRWSVLPSSCSGLSSAIPLLLAAALALGTYAPAPADEAAAPAVTREARKEVNVTVYNQDLGLVKEVREFPLAAGESVIRFEDVASRID